MMSLLLISAFLGDASGSAGGVTASRNASGLHYYATPTPTNPNTQAQQNVRRTWAFLVSYWRTRLTPSQRDAWRAYADTLQSSKWGGRYHRPTPLQTWLRTNVPRRLARVAIIVDPPQHPGHPTITPSPVKVSAGVPILGVSFDPNDDWFDVPGNLIYAYATAQYPPTVNYPPTPPLFLGVKAAVGQPVKQWDLPYTPTEAYHIWYVVRVQLHSGEWSPLLRGMVTVIP